MQEYSFDLLSITIASQIDGILYKADLDPDPDPQKKWTPEFLEKADPILKLVVLVKHSYLTNLRVLISNMTIFLKILSQKYPNKAFLVPNLRIFFFRKILQSDKFKGADFKYDNSFLKF